MINDYFWDLSHLLKKARQYTNVNTILHVTNTLHCAFHVLYA